MVETSILANRYNLREEASPLQYNIIMELYRGGAMTRRDLVKSLGNPRTTVFDNLLKLQQINIVTKFARNNGERGRPKIFWKLSSE